MEEIRRESVSCKHECKSSKWKTRSLKISSAFVGSMVVLLVRNKRSM